MVTREEQTKYQGSSSGVAKCIRVFEFSHTSWTGCKQLKKTDRISKGKRGKKQKAW